MADLEGITQANRPKKIVNVIEPNTKRVLQLRAIREAEQKKNLQKKELQQRKREEQRKRLLTYERLKKNQELQEKEKLLDEERRRRQEQEQSTRLVGKFGHMINDLNTNTTNLQFTTSGLDLRPAQIKVLISNVQNNSSLKCLTLNRKSLTDVEGGQISQRLGSNQYLQRLELQGNNISSQTLQSLAQLIKTNETLRSIDLEGNKLIKSEKQGKPNYKGISSLAQSLKQNTTLLSLNLYNTGLDKEASSLLRKAFEQNDTLILLDIQNNPQMDLEDVLAIQQKLIKNKQQYDDERYMEFIERKRKRRQEDISGVLLLNKQTKKLRGQAIQLNIKTKQAQLDEEWQEFLKKEQITRQKQIIKMEKEAGAKKKKKRR